MLLITTEPSPWPALRTGGFQQPSVQSANAWHQYTLHWDSTYIRLWVNGNLVLHSPSSEWSSGTQSKASNYDAPFDQPFHFMFNLAVGGSWPGTAGAGTMPSNTVMQMMVDYIRVWQT